MTDHQGILARAIRDAFVGTIIPDPNVDYTERRTVCAVDGLFAIASAIHELAKEVRRLGNADAATPFGAIEAASMLFGEKLDDLTAAIAARNENP